MNARIAKKVLGSNPLDPHRKPSEQTPYSDGQFLAAAHRFRMGLKRGLRRHGVDFKAKWAPRDPRAPRPEWSAMRHLSRT